MQRIKRKMAKTKHLKQKRRARYMRVFNEHKHTSPDMFAEFPILLGKLMDLHIKYLQVMLEDLEKHANSYIFPWSGDYHKRIIEAAHTKILEKTLLKD